MSKKSVVDKEKAEVLMDINKVLREMQFAKLMVKELRSAVENDVYVDTDMHRQAHEQNAERLADEMRIICERTYGLQMERYFAQRFGKERKSPCMRRKLYGKAEYE